MRTLGLATCSSIPHLPPAHPHPVSGLRSDDADFGSKMAWLMDHLRLFLRTIGKDHHSASVPQSSNTFPHLWKNTLGHGSIPASARLPWSARARRRCRRLRRRRPYTATWLHFYGRRDSATPSGLSPSVLEDVPAKTCGT